MEFEDMVQPVMKTTLIGALFLMATTLGSLAEVLRLSAVVEANGEGIERMVSKAHDGIPERIFFVKKEVIVGDGDVETANVVPGGDGVISVLLTEEGGRKVKKVTAAMRRGVDRMAIILDGELIMAPVVQAVLFRNFVISVGSDQDLGELDNLARRISGRPLRPEGSEPTLPKKEVVETVPFTEEEYQERKAKREEIGVYFLERIPSEKELNKVLRIGMIYQDVVDHYGRAFGTPREPAEERFELVYVIAPEKASINLKRELVPIGFRVYFEEERVTRWKQSRDVMWREEKLVNPHSPEQPKPGPRLLKAEFPEFDTTSGDSAIFAFVEKIKIPDPEQELTKQDLLDLLTMVNSAVQLEPLGEEVEKPSLLTSCDLMKILAFNFPEVREIIQKSEGDQVVLKDLEESLSEYSSGKKPLPIE